MMFFMNISQYRLYLQLYFLVLRRAFRTAQGGGGASGSYLFQLCSLKKGGQGVMNYRLKIRDQAAVNMDENQSNTLYIFLS